ncbi:MAG: ABC transporter permease [Acidobacteria bacterium]|nr:ABC transporter permease [Acidobacteriota bacterium]
MSRSVWTDVRVAIRLLHRSPAFSATAILTLALGMSMTTLVFTLVNAVLLRPLPVADPERIVALSTAGEMAFLQQEPLAFADYTDLARDIPAFEAVVAHRRAPSVIGEGVGSRVALGEHVSANYFATLRLPFSLGRGFMPDDDPAGVAVLSHSMWQQHFGGDPAIVGRSLQLGGRARTIVGVAPEGFTGLFRGIAPEFWVPLDHLAMSRVEDRVTLQWWVHARLAQGVAIEQASAQLAGVGRTLAKRYPETNTGRTFRLERLEDASVHPAVPKGLVGVGALGVLAVALLFLIVACVNVANLVLGRSVVRQREIAIRTAVGASRSRIVRQMLVEGMVLALCAAILALLFVGWAGRTLSVVPLPIPITIDLHLSLDWRVFGFTMFLAVLTAIVFSVGPALRATRTAITGALSSDPRTSSSAGGSRWRTVLLSAQAAVTMVLLTLGGLALRSLAETTRVHPGFETEGVIVAAASTALVGYDRERALNFMNAAADRVRAVPGVQSASWMHPIPLSLNIRITRLRLPGQEGVATRELPFVDTAIAWPLAFEVLRIPVIEGREFTPQDHADGIAVALVNESFARRYWPGARAIGQRLAVGFPELQNVEVIGVVRDFKYRTLGDIARPMVFTSGLQDPLGWQGATLMVHQRRVGAVSLETMLGVLREVDPAVPLSDVQPLTDRMAGVLLLPRYAAALFGSVGIFSVSLIAVGLFGIVSFWVHSRTRELGIRLALGSARSAILWLVTKQTLLPVSVGAVLGMAAALIAARGLSVLLYGVSPQDPATLMASSAMIVATALLASALPAWRAARMDPMRALRTE